MWQNEGFQLFGELLLMDGHKKAVLFFELFSIILRFGPRERWRGNLADMHNTAHSPRFSFIT